MTRRHIRHTVLFAVAIMLTGVAVWRNYDYRRQDRLDGLGGRLHEAVRRGDTEDVRRLLALGAPVDSTVRHGSTPLWQAVSLGNEAAMLVLLDHGADVDCVDEASGRCLALLVAVEGGRTNIAARLVEHGATYYAGTAYLP